MTVERTLVLVKPDGVQRGLVGEVVARLERRGLKPVAMKLMQIDEGLAGRHYGEHREKPFFPGLVSFITSSPVVAMVWEGPPGSVAMVRAMMGPTNPAVAPPGTIRGDLAVDLGMNIIHGSDSPERAVVEVALFFDPAEIVDWEQTCSRWVVEEAG
jgi:nucleoside-diphosphate kinase